jgi:hypothetical protein
MRTEIVKGLDENLLIAFDAAPEDIKMQYSRDVIQRLMKQKSEHVAAMAEVRRISPRANAILQSVVLH